jgi:hypothetical protein
MKILSSHMYHKATQPVKKDPLARKLSALSYVISDTVKCIIILMLTWCLFKECYNNSVLCSRKCTAWNFFVSDT